LALSRALGDFDFKKNRSLIPEKQIITADPDVIVHDITGEDEFLVIACDGEHSLSRVGVCTDSCLKGFGIVSLHSRLSTSLD
jgi:hypothetical protein